MGHATAVTAAARADAGRGTVTVDVTDELDIATTPALRRDVEQVLAGRPQTLVVDLSACSFVGVDALGVLVDLTADARRQGTTLALVGLNPVARQAIALLDLDDALRYGSPRPAEARAAG